MAGVNAFDWYLERAINGLSGHVRALDWLGILFGQWGPLLVVLLVLWVWLRPHGALDNPSVSARAVRLTCAYVGADFVLGLIVSVLISHFVYRDRPFVLAPQVVNLVVYHAKDSSFPSDHTTMVFGALAIAWAARYRLRGALTWVAVLTAVGRVYLGAHWPTDVLASMVVGWLSGRVVWSLRYVLEPILNPLVALLERVTPGAGRAGENAAR